jgi:hypothetical protein
MVKLGFLVNEDGTAALAQTLGFVKKLTSDAPLPFDGFSEQFWLVIGVIRT